MTEIVDKIFIGLKEVFRYYEKTGLSLEAFVKPEYLLTVKIAENIADIEKYIIVLEESTKVFARSSTPFFIGSNINDTHNTERNGQIDIAVYLNEARTGHYPYKPYFPIEVKLVSPYKHSLLLDIERNIQLLLTSDENGTSVINSSYNVFIEEVSNVFIEDIESEKNKAKEKYSLLLKKSNMLSPEIDFIIFSEEIDQTTLLYRKNGCKDDEYKSFLRIGIVIKLFKNKIFNYEN